MFPNSCIIQPVPPSYSARFLFLLIKLCLGYAYGVIKFPYNVRMLKHSESYFGVPGRPWRPPWNTNLRPHTAKETRKQINHYDYTQENNLL